MDIQIGDTVQVNDPSSLENGEIGTVEAIDGFLCLVRFADNETIWLPKYILDRITQQTSEEN